MLLAGPASPSHPPIVLVVVLPLFGAKRVPGPAKGLGAGARELREGLPAGRDAAEAGAHESGKVRGEKPHDGSGDGTVQTVGDHARRGGL